MPVRWIDLESAHDASDLEGGACGWVNAQTGEIRMHIPDADGDEPPLDGDPAWRAVPGGRELDLKQRLVWNFVDDVCPDLAEEVRRCFSHRGAWRAFKDLLARHRQLDPWHAFEGQARRRALLAWAAGEGITVVEAPVEAPPPPTRSGQMPKPAPSGHRCRLAGLQNAAYGPAITDIYEDVAGRMWAVTDGEYASEVRFCPACGRPASKPSKPLITSDGGH